VSNDALARNSGFDELAAVVACAFDPARDLPSLSDSQTMNRLLILAARHRVEGLVAAALGKRAPEALREAARRIASHNLQSAVESRRVLREFEAAGVDILFLKGLTVGALAWPRPMAKSSWDIDVLVAPETLSLAGKALVRLGYRLSRPSSFSQLGSWHRRVKESEWVLDANRIHLELHSRVIENPTLFPGAGLGTPRQWVPMPGGGELPTFSPAPLFAYLCVHGATSAWFRLKWLADLAALMHRAGPRQVEAWIDEASAVTHPRIVGLAMILTEQVFGPLVPARSLAPMVADPAIGWLVRTAGEELFGPRSLIEPTERRLGTLGIHFSQLRLRPGARFKAAELWRQWCEMTAG
jgi:Uncharacterised nucleotidyltransferase